MKKSIKNQKAKTLCPTCGIFDMRLCGEIILLGNFPALFVQLVEFVDKSRHGAAKPGRIGQDLAGLVKKWQNSAERYSLAQAQNASIRPWKEL